MEPTADALNEALPQTQCTRCGYDDCRSYAEAIASGNAEINRCPPGGAQGIARLAALTGRPLLPLDTSRGNEGPRLLAVIDEAWCIGCTLCLQACPVDSIVGGPKSMHTVMDWLCTGCELCVPVCPVDCISLTPVSSTLTGWSAWGQVQAEQARERHVVHRARLEREGREEAERLAALSQPSAPSAPSAPCAAFAAPAAPAGSAAFAASAGSGATTASHSDATAPTASGDPAELRAQVLAAALARARSARDGRRGE